MEEPYAYAIISLIRRIIAQQPSAMARISLRLLLVLIPATVLYLTAIHLNIQHRGLPAIIRNKVIPPPPLPPILLPKHPLFKPDLDKEAPAPPVVENFPLAQAAHSAADLPPIPSWNRPPEKHVPEHTPLFIGFTRNWRILQQAVVGYITAGWPPEDIYVLENTGTMDANANGQLSLQNPFFLNHTRLHMLGVNVITTPTLLTFAQLQNFMIHTALSKKWDTYFWSHMDVGILSEEQIEPFKSIYEGAVDALRNTTKPDYGKWAQALFAYDRLALVNTKAYTSVGGWDTQIPYYGSDCDMHERLDMEGYRRDEFRIGQVSDVGTSVDDLIVYYRKTRSPEPSFINPNEPPPLGAAQAARERMRIAEEEVAKQEASRKHRLAGEDKRSPDAVHLWDADDQDAAWPEHERGDESYMKLLRTLEAMDRAKNDPNVVRNTWQHRQTGGEGEPYYKDPRGFEKALWLWVDQGRNVFAEKWGHRDCDLIASGLRPEHAWKVDKDWVVQEKLTRERKEKEKADGGMFRW